MNDKGDPNRFDRVDAENDPSYFVKFLDARRSNPEEQIVKQRMIDMLQPLEGQRVLDVGCGTGDDSREIASLVGPDGRVVGIDYSAAMVAEARRRSEFLRYAFVHIAAERPLRVLRPDPLGGDCGALSR